MTENQVSLTQVQLTELATDFNHQCMCRANLFDFIHHVNVEKGLAVCETTLAKIWQQVTGA